LGFLNINFKHERKENNCKPNYYNIAENKFKMLHPVHNLSIIFYKSLPARILAVVSLSQFGTR